MKNFGDQFLNQKDAKLHMSPPVEHEMEREKTEESYKDIGSLNKSMNPHDNSAIPEKLNLDIKKKNGIIEEYQDEESGDIYFKKRYWAGRREDHQKEHFVSLLTKGVLHSSEMVRIDENDFFSRKINLENTQKGELFEKEAEFFLLKTILGDIDRGGFESENLVGNHNVDHDENGRFSFYDFTMCFESYEFIEIHKNPKNAYKIFHKFCEDNKFSSNDIHNFSLEVSEKLNSLEQAVSDQNFISAILEKTGFEPSTERVDADKAKGVVSEIKKYFYSKGIKEEVQDVKIEKIRNLLLEPITAMKKVVKMELEKKR